MSPAISEHTKHTLRTAEVVIASIQKRYLDRIGKTEWKPAYDSYVSEYLRKELIRHDAFVDVHGPNTFSEYFVKDKKTGDFWSISVEEWNKLARKM